MGYGPQSKRREKLCILFIPLVSGLRIHFNTCFRRGRQDLSTTFSMDSSMLSNIVILLI